MRRIVITSPGLTIGAQGTVLTAERMGMDDDRIDEFIEAGYGHELFDEVELAPEETVLDDQLAEQPADAPGDG